MSKQVFDAQNDVTPPAPDKGPRMIVTVVIVLGLIGLILLANLPQRPSRTVERTGETTEDAANIPAETTATGTAVAATTTTTAETAAPAEEPKKEEKVEETKPTPPAKRTPPTVAEIAAAKKAGTRQAVISTSKGDIEVELFGGDAPMTVANFVKLAQTGYYDGLKFHRVVPGFVIQGGDPEGTGGGGPGYTIKLEIAPNLKHWEGALAMARTPDPDSAGSQYYITLAPQPGLDKQYAVFGKVKKGMEVVKSIKQGDKMTKVVVK